MSRLSEERNRASINEQAVKELWFSGHQNVLDRERAKVLIERDEILVPKLSGLHLTQGELRRRGMEQVSRIVQLRSSIKKDKGLLEAFDLLLRHVDRGVVMRLGVHDMLFRTTVQEQGTNEQAQFWDSKAAAFQVIGCFGMTELGTSSYLRGIETTATYDIENHQFIIHSPTLTSTKFWIGMAGETATHCVVLAQLIIRGEQKGLFWFVVQLRDLHSGLPLPGVSLGDVGPKAGRHTLDNGWIQFSQVRIPREQMLMRWAKVEIDGSFTAPADSAISYASLVGERVTLLEATVDDVTPALVIAIRYGAIRKQGPTLCILDYQAHYCRLIPPIAVMFAIKFFSRTLRKQYENIQNRLHTGDTVGFLHGIQEIHAISSGMKCWCGWFASDTLEDCRRCMGGYGFSSYSGIPAIINEWGVLTQGGGPNAVVAQQHARWLLSNFSTIGTGRSLPSRLEFFYESEKILSQKTLVAQSMEEILDFNKLIHMHQWLVISLLNFCSARLTAGGNGNDLSQNWNDNMMHLLDLSRVHTQYELLLNFVQTLPSVENLPLRNVLHKLCYLMSVVHVRSVIHLYFERGFINGQQSLFIREAVIELSKALRPEAVPLVDGFDIPEFALKSPFGRYDGDVFLHFFQEIKNQPPNPIKYWKELVAPWTSSKL